MENLTISALMDDGREICISPISRETFEASELDTLGDDCGFFIYEVDPRRPGAGIEILAKVASYEAALRLLDIFFNCHGRLAKPQKGDKTSPKDGFVSS